MAKSKSKGIGLVREVACAPSPMKATRQQIVQEQRWRAESDLRTLREAEHIRTDPGRVRMARTLASEEVRALSKVAKGSK